jgi:heptosyltransferase-2
MKILLIQTGFIGDLILSTPVIAGIQKLYPEASLSVLTTPVCSPLLQADSRLSEVLVFDKRKDDKGLGGLYRMIKKLRAKSYDKIFSLHKSHRTALLVALSGAAEKYGFEEASMPFLYTKVSPRADLKHDVLRNLAILRNVGVNVEEASTPMQLKSSTAAVEVANEFLQKISSRPLIGVAPGSVWLTKRWTESGFRNFVRLASARGWGVALLGGPNDIELAETIRDGNQEVLNLCGKLQIDESVAFIRNLDVLVSNDSSPLHMASATGTPVVALFCATVPEFGYGPWMVPHKILGVPNLECRPCGRHGGNTCPTGTHACREGITPESVVQAVDLLLEQTKGSDASSRNENL